MQYTILIAAAFLVATIAVAALSPFDNLPQRPPQREAAITPPTPRPPGAQTPDDDSYDGESSGDEDGADADDSDGSETGKSQSAAAEPAGDESFSGVDEEPVGEYYGEENRDASDD